MTHKEGAERVGTITGIESKGNRTHITLMPSAPDLSVYVIAFLNRLVLL
jgi:hypothetical protein